MKLLNKPSEYMVRIYWSAEDEAFVALIPALPGCVSHGETQIEAMRNINEAATLWLESAARHGDPIPSPSPARARLDEMGNLLNIAELARRCGVKRSTLNSKLKRGTRFTPEEDKAVSLALESRK